MSIEIDQIRASLRERRLLDKKDRSSFPAPESIKESKQALVHWSLGVIVQDEPIFVAIAIASILYYAIYGGYTLLAMMMKG